MWKGLPWEANRSSASQEIPRVVWNSKFYHRVHKRPPPVRILSQISTVHASPTHFFHFNIIFPSTLKSSNLALSLRFLHQNPGWTSPLPIHVLRAPPIALFSIWSPEQHLVEYRSLSYSLCTFLHSPVTSFLLGPNTLLSTLFSNTLSLRSSLNVSDQVSHSYKTTGKIIVLYILIFRVLDSKLEDKRFCTE